MRRAVPGTWHSSPLHRDECAILDRVERAPSVKKFKAGRIENTRSSRLKLQLRPHALAGKIDSIVSAWLHIGGGKRLVTLYTAATITLEALRDELAAALEDFGIPVEVFESNCHREENLLEHQPQGESTMAIAVQAVNHAQASTLDKDHLLTICDLIADLMIRVRSRLPEQARLRAELDTVSAEIEQAQNDAMSLLAQALDKDDLPKAL